MRRTLALLLVLFLSIWPWPAAHAGPNDIAIVIGIKSYGDGTPEVKFAINDMEAFAKAATDVFGVPRELVRKFPDASLGTFFELFGRPGAPGEPGAGSLLERLIQSRSTRVLIFYSGHGVPVFTGPKPRSHLLPRDSSPAAAASTAFALDDLVAAVKSVMARKAPDGQAIIILDACFSGSSGDGGSLIPNTSGTAFNIDMAAIANAERVTVMAASSDTELAHWDTDRRHGLFTDSLLDGLYGEADGNRDRSISLAELETFVASRMRSRLLSLHKGRPATQSPRFTGRGTAEVIKLGATLPERNPGAKETEERECNFLLQFGQLAAIESFIARSTCPSCPCRIALEVKRRQLSTVASSCDAEQRLWDIAKTSGDLAQVRWFVANAKCPPIKAAAEALVRNADEEERLAKKRREDEQLRLEEQQRRAEAERKRLAELEEERRRAEAERKRLAALEEEQRRAEAERKRLAALEEERRRADEDRRRRDDEDRRRAEEEARRNSPDEQLRRNTGRTWDHNGSSMRIVLNGSRIEIRYVQPRSGMVAEGVGSGELLFHGTITGGSISGTAYRFSRQCGKRSYTVTGTVSNGTSIVLRGTASRIDRNTCRTVDTYMDTLEFSAQ